MLYLFTSNRRPRYLQDALDVLALPNGAHYHFRYDGPRWVQDEIRTLFKSKAVHDCRDEDAVIVLVHMEKENDSTEATVRGFYPLRRARVQELEQDGAVIHAYFTVGEYIDWYGSSVQHWEQELHSDLGEQNCPPRIFLSRSNGAASDNFPGSPSDMSPNAWQAIVGSVVEIPDLRSIVFYRMNSVTSVVRDRHSRWLSQRLRTEPITEIMPGEFGYRLQGGHVFYVDLSFFQPEGTRELVERQKIVTQVSPDYFVNRPVPIDINFSYDKCEVPLLPKKFNEPVITLLSIGLEENQPASRDETEPVRAPRLLFHVELPYSQKLFYGAGIALALIQIVGHVASNPDGILPPLGFGQPWIDFFTASAPVLSVVVPAITAFIILLLTRKLPGS